MQCRYAPFPFFPVFPLSCPDETGARSHTGGKNPTSAIEARTYRHRVPLRCTMVTQEIKSRVTQKKGSQQSSIFALRKSGSSALFIRNPEKYETTLRR
jgi:hypothetical protein